MQQICLAHWQRKREHVEVYRLGLCRFCFRGDRIDSKVENTGANYRPDIPIHTIRVRREIRPWKLNEDQIQAIISSDLGPTACAAQFGISKAWVSRLRSERR